MNSINNEYRKDIDGLRAIAVISVILFHLHCLPNGYLGVDIFFVISGFLITKIISKEIETNNFSVINFYIRRIRRIIPLVLTIDIVALIVGFLVMLPDDIENLAQSIIATNTFWNNILQYIVTKDYWNILNDFKPLMHTWSLGIEEQYYLIYPLLFLFAKKKGIKHIINLLIILTILSLCLFLLSSNTTAKFYFLQYRFFELCLGGIGSFFIKDNLVKTKSSQIILLFFLFIILYFGIGISKEINLLIVVVISLYLLISANSENRITSIILENKILVFIGKISFSLYMWHQLIIAFARYFVFEEINKTDILWMLCLIVFLSTLSYLFIEQPFRNKVLVKTKPLLIIVSLFFIVTTGISFFLHQRGGIIKDVPELGIISDKPEKNTQVTFNMRILDYQDKKFSDQILNKEHIKVLIIGNSLSRDWANVLLSSKYTDAINMSYIRISKSYSDEINKSNTLQDRWNEADIVYISYLQKEEMDSIIEKYNLADSKYYIIGIKNFGISNGIYYNHKKNSNYYNQRTKITDDQIKLEADLIKQYGKKYININESIIDNNKLVPVFTGEGRFISQDCIHLTKSGAKFFGSMIEYSDHFYLKKFSLPNLNNKM